MKNVSTSTICRALKFDLGLTRKKITKRTREAKQIEVDYYFQRLQPFYFNQEMLLFIDETSKDGRDAARLFGWSKKGQRAYSWLPNSRGDRVSALVAIDVHGSVGWGYAENTFTRGVSASLSC